MRAEDQLLEHHGGDRARLIGAQREVGQALGLDALEVFRGEARPDDHVGRDRQRRLERLGERVDGQDGPVDARPDPQARAQALELLAIGRASCRERV